MLTLKTGDFTPTEWALIEKFAPCIAFDEREVFFPKRVGVSLIYRNTHPPSLIAYFKDPPMHRRIFKYFEHFGLTMFYGHFPWIYEVIRDRFQPVKMTYLDGLRKRRAAKVIEYAVNYDSDIQHIYDLEHIWVYLDLHNNPLAIKGTRHGLITTIYSNPQQFRWSKGHILVYASPGKHEIMGNLRDLPRLVLLHVNNEKVGVEGMYPVQFFTLDTWKKVNAVNPGKMFIHNYFLTHYAHIPTFRFTKYLIPHRPMLCPWSELEQEIPGRVICFLRKIIGEAEARLEDVPTIIINAKSK